MVKSHSFEALELVGEAPHGRLDSITRLAASVLGAPISLASVMQPHLDRLFFTSSIGLPDDLAAERQTPLDVSICRHVQSANALLSIPDLQSDARTAANPLVLEHGLRSYIGAPIHAASGQAIGALCCINTEFCEWTHNQAEILLQLAACVDDLIELSTLRIEEQKANRKLRAIAGARSSFIAHISHELRTPLTGMIGSIRLLGQFKLDKTAGELVQLLNRSSMRLLDILDDTSDLSHIDSGAFRIEQEETDLEQIAADIIDLHRPAAQQKAVHVAWDSALSEQIYLVDRKALVSVLDNLFANAVKFTVAGSAKLLLSQDNYGNVVIRVTDTGIGISSTQQANLFDEFEQAGPRIARKYGGTGLGMAMVRRLVELMDGDIDLSSQQGHGTTITITLPLESVKRKMTRIS
jgi:signal transduction histidine kinase